MAKTRNQDFVRGTDREQARAVHLSALVAIAAVAVLVALVAWVTPRMSARDTLKLSVDVPSVAPGVGAGTKVILRGAEVGEVTRLDRTAGGAVRIALTLRPDQVRGLTDSFGLDFRSANYFGLSAVNVIGRPGGQPLTDGQRLRRLPAGDYTMSTMIENASIDVEGTLTKPMISALDKVVRYTDGLTPMIQTGIVFADRVAHTQQAYPSVLIGDMNQILDVLPAFDYEVVGGLYQLFDNRFNRLPDGSFGLSVAEFDEAGQGLGLAASNLFGAAGHLLASHGAELTPVVGMVQAFSDIVPDVLDGGTAAAKVGTLLDRYNHAFTGPADAKTLNMRIVLDELPMIAAPLAATGAAQPRHQEQPR
jgi:hypothetical protein